MKQHRINDAWNFIGGWYIDEILCDFMVKDFENKIGSHKTAPLERGYTYTSMGDLNSSLVTAYEIQLHSVLTEYINLYKYSKETIAPFQLEKPYNVQKYDPGMFYSVWHCENNGSPPYNNRHLAFSTYLNDVEKYGETEFLYQNVKIRPEKGLTLIWPAGFTHIHRGCPTPDEEKYMVTGWFEYFSTESFLNRTVNMEDEDFYKQIDNLGRNVI